MTTPHTLTLAGPTVTASVTWDDVRRYLRAEGWEATSERDAVCRTLWRKEPSRGMWIGSLTDRIEDVVSNLARLANVAPGVMLARIAAGPFDASAYTWAEIEADSTLLDRYRRAVCAANAPDPSTTPSARVPCLNCGRPCKPGHPCPLCDDPDVSIPWRERPEPWIAALASLPDDVAAGMAFAWLAQSRAQTDAARVESDEAADLAVLARAYGRAWHAFDVAGDAAERAHGGRRGDYDDATKERLSALAHERSAAHVALLRAMGIDTR